MGEKNERKVEERKNFSFTKLHFYKKNKLLAELQFSDFFFSPPLLKKIKILQLYFERSRIFAKVHFIKSTDLQARPSLPQF